MVQDSEPLNWSTTSVVADYTAFSREFFWNSYNWQAAIGLYHSGIIKTGGNILDIGCGPGWITFLLKERCPVATCSGVDLSAEMIERARDLAQERGYEDIHFAVSDVQHLPFKNNAFDLVMSSSSFRLWGNIEAGLREAYRVLRPGGLLFISDIGGDISQEQRQMILETVPRENYVFMAPALETALTRAQVEEILHRSGLQQWECRMGGMCGFQPNERIVVDWLGDGFPLRELQKLSSNMDWKQMEWVRELRRSWLYIYIQK